MNFRFQHNNLTWLWLVLLALIFLFAAFLYWKRKVRKRIGEEKLVKALTKNFSSKLFNWKFILIGLAMAAGILAAMNPGRMGDTGNVKRKGIDIAIAIDVSRSMMAADLAPNRLERAKQFVGKLMDEMPDDRIALILFAGKAYMQMPLTTDHGAAKLFVSTASPEAVPQQGTVISDALDMSARAFSTTDKRFKTIILISDGEDHDNDAEKMAKDLSEQGVMINTVGVGSAEGAVIPDPLTGENKKDGSGNTVISKLNDAILRSVAEKTNGIYINLQGSDEAVTMIKAQLSQIERKSFSDMSLMNFKTFYAWLAAAMFLLLLAENFIPERKKDQHMRWKMAIWGLLFAKLSFGQSAPAERSIRTGNEFYKKQEYGKAVAEYNKALQADPNNNTAKFNQANTLYKQDQKVEAVQIFNSLSREATGKDLRSKSFYNKGVILSQQKNLEESIVAYKHALRNEPGDKEARENLQKALLELKKKTPPPKKEEKKDKKKQEQQRQKQPPPKMNPREAEQRLKLLQQKEKEVQQRLQKEMHKAGGSQAKDW